LDNSVLPDAREDSSSALLERLFEPGRVISPDIF